MLAIDDSCNKGAKLIFICESPHIDEVKLGFPLAGYSGREMSKYLLGNTSISLGEIGRNFSSYKELDLRPFSLINASQVPLQKIAYVKNNLNIPENINLLERIRKISNLSCVDSDLLGLVNLFYESFKERCSKFDEGSLFVPCGVFARSFFRQLDRDIPQTFNYLDGIPHPSRKQWKNLTPIQLAKMAIKT